MSHFGNGKSSRHCVRRCKSLMSFTHPKMMELPVKRSAVLSMEMGDSVEVKRHIYLRIITKQKVYAEFDLMTLSANTNTSFGRRQTTKYNSDMV